MESARLSDEEITNLIFYGVKENGLDPQRIRPIDIKMILT